MDFLRRLAPPRDGDRSRAVAVLPSRFASELPLRSVTSESAASVDDVPVSAAPRRPSALPDRPSKSVAMPAELREPSDPVTRAATLRVAAALPEPPARVRDPMQPVRPAEPTAKAEARVVPRRDADPIAEPPL
ncbi:MAG TPA: hypothetical protein VJ598_06990, partial [Albitalea sp.]|nr:hypothetical protein [Albitalea sp.]